MDFDNGSVLAGKFLLRFVQHFTVCSLVSDARHLRKQAVADAVKRTEKFPPVQIPASAAAIPQHFVHSGRNQSGILLPIHQPRAEALLLILFSLVDKSKSRPKRSVCVGQLFPAGIENLQAGNVLLLLCQIGVSQGRQSIQHRAEIRAYCKYPPGDLHGDGQIPGAHACWPGARPLSGAA
nr:MAG TPA: hypothetical protein [Caudoviricetes sp.]